MSNTNADDTLECYNLVREKRSLIAKISQEIATIYGRFENRGVNTDAVKFSMMLGKKNDPQGFLKAGVIAAAQIGIIPTETEDDGQVSFMPGLEVPKPSPTMVHKVRIADAFNQGYIAGRAGAPDTNNLFAAGSEERLQWSKGHIDGQADRAVRKAAKAKPNVSEAPTERRGRGRPRKATVETTTILERDEAAYRAGVQAEAAAEIAQTEQERAG